MFGFAIWDSRQKTLFIARDRVGIKPVYYSVTRTGITFGSEIKALLADPEVRAEVSTAIIDRFLTFYYVPGEETLFRNINKLAPGHFLTVRDGKVQIKQYWDLHFAASKQSMESAESELLELLEESVKLHMISDVPVGFLLSGGVDSTAMLSLATGKTDRPISSYTIGFSDPGVTDERPYARLAAKRFGSEHHEMTIRAKDFVDFLPQYIWHMEEPVCEPPAVALFYVSRLAKDYVKVLISGEGGDEAFAGYPNYRIVPRIEHLKRILGPFNGAASACLSIVNKFAGSDKISKYRPLFTTPFEKYYYSRTSSPFGYFNSTTELYSKDFAHSVDKNFSVAPVAEFIRNANGTDILSKMLYVDSKTWLPDDLLIKADKITMANSVELRVPLLDHKILEFGASLPSAFKVRGLETKYIAKMALSRHVPKEILDRKKTGFPVPYERWLRTDLRGWLSDILLDRETLSRGYFERSGIERLIERNSESGKYSKEVFSLAVLELWHREFLGKKASPTPQPQMAPEVPLATRG
jgi:asparagine synthase (glutamine-hydrolysing)